MARWICHHRSIDFRLPRSAARRQDLRHVAFCVCQSAFPRVVDRVIVVFGLVAQGAVGALR
jgi:hypothetical protein